MPFADVGAASLFYTDEGTGDPAVLLVHGWSCDSHDWSWQIPAFAGRHRVIAADNRGHGRSSVPAGGYTPRQFASDLAGLLKNLDSGPVVAVGHSLGGVIVSALAVEHPELVRAVVVVDPAYGVAGGSIDSLTGILEGLRGPCGHSVAAATFTGMEAEATPLVLTTWHGAGCLARRSTSWSTHWPASTKATTRSASCPSRSGTCSGGSARSWPYTPTGTVPRGRRRHTGTRIAGMSPGTDPVTGFIKSARRSSTHSC